MDQGIAGVEMCADNVVYALSDYMALGRHARLCDSMAVKRLCEW